MILMMRSKSKPAIRVETTIRALIYHLLQMNSVDMIFDFILGVSTKRAVRTLVIEVPCMFHMYVPSQYILVVGAIITKLTLHIFSGAVHALLMSSQQAGLRRRKIALITFESLSFEMYVLDVRLDIPWITGGVVAVFAGVWALGWMIALVVSVQLVSRVG